eukprot:RCo004945
MQGVRTKHSQLWCNRAVFSWIALCFGRSNGCTAEETEALMDICRNLCCFRRPVLLSNLRLDVSWSRAYFLTLGAMPDFLLRFPPLFSVECLKGKERVTVVLTSSVWEQSRALLGQRDALLRKLPIQLALEAKWVVGVDEASAQLHWPSQVYGELKDVASELLGEQALSPLLCYEKQIKKFIVKRQLLLGLVREKLEQATFQESSGQSRFEHLRQLLGWDCPIPELVRFLVVNDLMASIGAAPFVQTPEPASRDHSPGYGSHTDGTPAHSRPRPTRFEPIVSAVYPFQQHQEWYGQASSGVFAPPRPLALSSTGEASPAGHHLQTPSPVLGP